MFGGFLGCGSALDVYRAIDESDVENIEGVFHDGSKPNGPDGADYYGWLRLHSPEKSKNTSAPMRAPTRRRGKVGEGS